MHRNIDKFYLNTLLQHTANNISFVDKEYTYRAISQSYLNTFNKTSQEIVNKKIWNIVGQKSFDTIKPHIDKAFLGQSIEYEAWFDFPNDKRIYMKVSYAPIYNNKDIIGVVATSTDLTEVKLLQMENENQYKLLLEKTKSAKLGNMLAFITHQMRQPLNTLSTSLVKMDTLVDEKDYKSLQEIINLNENILTHLSKTLDSVSEYHNLSNHMENINVSYLIESTLVLLEHSIHKQNIKIELDLNKELHIDTIKSELIHILLILLINAIDALKQLPTEKKIKIVVHTLEQKTYFDIYDNANGVEKRIAQNLFQPGNTSKSEIGHGYGLYFAKNILHSSLNGTISYHENENTHFFRVCI